MHKEGLLKIFLTWYISGLIFENLTELQILVSMVVNLSFKRFRHEHVFLTKGSHEQVPSIKLLVIFIL